MKVYIGPYTNWISPYQIANSLKKIGFSEDRCDKIGDWLADTWVKTLCQWCDSKKKRKINIEIEPYDTWSMDHTLALIIVPMLKQLNETKHGAPFVDDEDVPEELKSTSAPPKENEWDTDENYFKRWDWVMNEMIWSFEQIIDDDSDSKFYSGTHDFSFEYLNPEEKDKEKKVSKLVRSPNDTFKVDTEGLHAHQQRIRNGTRLFGKYYQNLWD
jgi:hypothetical protein